MTEPIGPAPPVRGRAPGDSPGGALGGNPGQEGAAGGDGGRRDRRLLEIIESMTDRLRRGEAPDLERSVQEHPDLASEVRELWSAAMIAEALGGSTHQEIAASAGGPGAAAGPEGAARVGSAESAGATAASGGVGVGHRLGQYELTEELGRGGMGIVFKARQRSPSRFVALKLLLEGERSSPDRQRRFRAEAEAAARLDHPHIVPVHEVGEAAGAPYFTMRWIDGETLAQRLQGGPLTPREAAAILAPIARAIDHAHRQGLLHRDLKPSNILIDREDRPYVTDFGLARQLEWAPGDPSSLTQSGAILGTPSYMAPEQAAGSRGTIGPPTDVYGLGAILYHMLCGRPPFQSATPVDTVLSVLEEDPLPPRLVNPHVDRDLEMVALKCLQKPADLRYAAAADLAEDLEAYLAGEPVTARSSSFFQLWSRMFRETHHAAILKNWGLLWMWHSAALIVLCTATDALRWSGFSSPPPYLLLWTVGFGAWAGIFWALRRRSGPITFVERQVAHVWAASVAGSVSLFILEMLMGLPVLSLAPVLGLIGGMVFLVKAGILTGAFYWQAAVLFITSGIMAVLPWGSLTLFGIVNAACFFIPGFKYHRQRRLGSARRRPDRPPG